MKTRVKATMKQLEGINDILSNLSSADRRKKRYTLYTHPMVNDSLYVKHQSYGVGDDNSFVSQMEISCVGSDGSVSDCLADFETVKAKYAFMADFIEVDIKPNGEIEIL